MTRSKQAVTTYMNVWNPARYETGGNMMKISANMAPAMNSTNGYCHEILLLHFLHEPFWNAKLNIGTSSFQVRLVPHDMHFDRPPRPTPVLKRSDTTLRKLPTMAPKMNERIVGNRGMRYFVIPAKTGIQS